MNTDGTERCSYVVFEIITIATNGRVILSVLIGLVTCLRASEIRRRGARLVVSE